MKNLLLFLSIFSIGLVAAQDKGSGKYTIKNVEINSKKFRLRRYILRQRQTRFCFPQKRYYFG